MLICMQNLVKFCPLVPKIWSGNYILTSIKGHNSVANFRNLTLKQSQPRYYHVNVYTKFGKILFIGSQDIEWKRNSDINLGL